MVGNYFYLNSPKGQEFQMREKTVRQVRGLKNTRRLVNAAKKIGVEITHKGHEYDRGEEGYINQMFDLNVSGITKTVEVAALTAYLNGVVFGWSQERAGARGVPTDAE